MSILFYNRADTCGDGGYGDDDCGGTIDYQAATLHTSDAQGFKFTASSGYSTYGVAPYIDYSAGSGETMTCRIGTAVDLSSYDRECTSAAISGDGYLDCPWSSGSGGCFTLTGSTTYYVGCIVSGGTNYLVDTSSEECNNRQYAAGSGGWNIDQSTGEDIMFEVILDD